MKTSLQAIDTTDRHYLNYNKTKFEQCISKNSEKIKTSAPILEEQAIIDLTNAAKPNQKPKINFQQTRLKSGLFDTAKDRLEDLFQTSVVSKTIQKFVDDENLKSWIEDGLKLHDKNQTSECEYCGNTITEERIKELEGHFNDNYKAFQARLTSANGWLQSQFINKPTLPATNDFYEEFQNEYSQVCNNMDNSIEALNSQIEVWHSTLKIKLTNPLELRLKIDSINESSINYLNDTMVKINTIVEKHNHKSNNFFEETTKSKEKLELHFATSEVNDFGYHQKNKEVKERESSNNELNIEIGNRNKEILILEDSLSNEGIGADQFNKSLHRFLGRSELTLRFNPEKKGYEILRNNSNRVDGNLSEGEKTAIAFVYFITKLKENDNNIENTIVVVDDPISSFDSNHLFHAYSFMKVNCENAKQLFVLTHNFTFFKLVRDWISRKNKKTDQNIANFYVVKSDNEQPRSSLITDADTTLVSYNSEYHYIFSRLHSLKNQQTLAIDDHFLAANLSRKLLEAFLSFKFPKNRGNFANLFSQAVKASNNPEDERKEKIRKFINEYSHNDLIEINEEFVENLIGESPAVISDIFNWINELDEKHYQEMIDVVS